MFCAPVQIHRAQHIIRIKIGDIPRGTPVPHFSGSTSAGAAAAMPTVHKNILASESIAFANFFDSLTPDSPCSNVVEITGYPHHIVETAIKFCYFRNFVVPLTFEDAILLLQFFDEYKIELLKKQFVEFLINQISVTTVTRLGQCAIKCHAKQLQEKCDAFYYNR
uniref:BTB domain-containing protein n=1 Tax=Panagrolaimus davidi TaxID=227884 RepID=A0A914QZP5_9BILA